MHASIDVPLAWDILNGERFGGVRWFAKRDGSSMGGKAYSKEKLWDVSLMSRRGWNTFVQLNPSTKFKGPRAGVTDIDFIQGFMVDLDWKPEGDPPLIKVGANQDELRMVTQDVIAQAEEVLEIPLTPTIIATGRGAQLWFMFSPVEARDTVDYQAGVAQLLKRLNASGDFEVDQSVKDLARVGRLPGSVNQKNNQMSYLMERGKPIDGLYEALTKLGQLHPVETVEGRPTGDSYRDIFVFLTVATQNFILHGKSYPGRHTAAWHAAKNLREHGLSRDAIFNALWLGAKISNPPLTKDEVTYAVKRAFGEA